MKKGNIDPDFFEMPVDRLLTEEEERQLNQKGIKTTWISCLNCRQTGATTDGREFCSLKCYAEYNRLDYNAVLLMRKAAYLDEAAREGEMVRYNDRYMKVISTNFSREKIQDKYRATYSYVLMDGAKMVKLFNLEAPLRRVGYNPDHNDLRET